MGISPFRSPDGTPAGRRPRHRRRAAGKRSNPHSPAQRPVAPSAGSQNGSATRACPVTSWASAESQKQSGRAPDHLWPLRPQIQRQAPACVPPGKPPFRRRARGKGVATATHWGRRMGADSSANRSINRCGLLERPLSTGHLAGGLLHPVVIDMTAVMELNAGVRRGCLVPERRREVLTAVHVLHGLLRGSFVLPGVVGNTAVLESGGSHGGMQKQGMPLGRAGDWVLT